MCRHVACSFRRDRDPQPTDTGSAQRPECSVSDEGAVPPNYPSRCCRVTFSSLRIALNPVLRILLELLTVLPVFVGNRWFNSVVRVRFDEERLDEAKDRNNLVRRLPLIRAQQTQTHGALVVIADIGVVDLGAEGNDRRLERVLVGECDLELEMPTLSSISLASNREWARDICKRTAYTD